MNLPWTPDRLAQEPEARLVPSGAQRLGPFGGATGGAAPPDSYGGLYGTGAPAATITAYYARQLSALDWR